MSNTLLRGSQYVKGRAYYDRFYNELDSFDDARYTTMTRPSSFRSIYDDYSGGGSVEYGTAIGEPPDAACGGTLQRGHPPRAQHRQADSALQQPDRVGGHGRHDRGVADGVGRGRDRRRSRRPRCRRRISSPASIADFPAGHGGRREPASRRLRRHARRRAACTPTSRARPGFPAIKDRYSYRMGAAIPNPDLKAEQATTAEVGYDRSVPRLGHAVAWWLLHRHRRSGPAVLSAAELFQLQNVGNVEIRGSRASGGPGRCDRSRDDSAIRISTAATSRGPACRC